MSLIHVLAYSRWDGDADDDDDSDGGRDDEDDGDCEIFFLSFSCYRDAGGFSEVVL